MADLTDKERAEYNALSYKDQQRYDFEKKMDPSLSHAKIIKIIGLRIVSEDVIKEGGKDVNPNDPRVQKKIFEKFRIFLERFPEVLAKVGNAIDRAIDYLDDLIWKGVEIVVDLATSIWDFFKGCF